MNPSSDRPEAVAIVGLACRLPQAADPGALWRLLVDETDAVTAFPEDRLGTWDGDPDELPRSGFLDRVDTFDAELFGIAPREAVAMDPQQRVALELVWEAMEDAGIDPGRHRAGPVAVVLGMMNGDYADVLAAAGDEAGGRHALTGLQRSIAANRISHCFGFDGPSLVVDTGQSSGLSAVHMACETLRTGTAEMALAGAVNLILSPLSSIRAQQFGAMSPDGHAYVFDARANGYVRGEGGGMLVLKRLSDARRDGDRIHAVIHGSAMRSGTGDSGLTAPSAAAQRQVITDALERSGVDPAAVGYVELHGTGTQAGDPIEAAALGAVYGAARPADRPLMVGSIKTNIGHLEGAAGLAGLLKASLCVGRGWLVRSLNFESPNPGIDPDALRLQVVDRAQPWPDGPRFAGVSSFGVGGANCHLVLGAPPEAEPAEPAGPEPVAPSTVTWALSGHTDAALRAQAERLGAHAAAHPELSPLQVGHALATARAPLTHRAVVAGTGREALVAAVETIAGGEPADDVARGRAGAAGKVAFVFPGQGSQWVGMGLELWDAAPAFAAAMDACADALAPYCDWSLRDVLAGGPGAPSMERLDVVQPALFAVSVALAALWEAYGVHPDAVVGHSQGEIPAAYVAGALTLEDAARAAALRSRALATLQGTGAMMSVLDGADAVQARLRRWDGRLTLAAFNGPGAVTVAGDLEALAELQGACEADGVKARRVPAADVASHSPHMEVLREQLLDGLGPVAPRSGHAAFCSAVEGELIDGVRLDADYWVRNVCEPVRFEQATRALLDDGVTTLLEISAHPVLTVPVANTIGAAGAEAAAIGTLRRDDGGMQRFLLSLGEAWTRGVQPDWSAVLPGAGSGRVALPGYAFQRRRFWIGEEPEAPASAVPALGGLEGAERRPALLELVRAQAAELMGYASAQDIDPGRAFRETGFDSLDGLELSSRLGSLLALDLPPSLVFDHPTPNAVADLLVSRLDGGVPVDGVQQAARPRAARPRSRREDPVAIVGIGCRYPGDVRSARDLWELVASGGDAIGPFPTDRGWDLASLYDADPDRHGKSYVRDGGFIADAADFDASFFGITPREALTMDPQQRLVLEVAWEALEHAGIDAAALHGSDAGVFCGISSQDYGSFLPGVAEDFEGLRMTGALTSVVTGRVAYSLGLTGPAVTVDTACSSSLAALHLACSALRNGECSLALAGGVTVLSSPGLFLEFSRQRGLAADGRCKAFAAAADGTSFADGVGLFVLKRFSDARHDGDRVLAVVRGSATNQDGASNGLTAPSGPSQERVIRRALADAGLDPADVDAVEAHGTGTTLGDPIEVGALLATYGQDRAGDPLWIGSVKSNIGHSHAAAGAAGLIKMVMALQAEQLPPTLHVDAPTPHADWNAGAVEILTEARPWPRSEERVRRAAVSGFGISGTNVHTVLEESPDGDSSSIGSSLRELPAADGAPVTWTVSARSEAALRAQAGRIADAVEADDLDALDTAWSLSARAQLPHRSAITGAGRAALLAGARAAAAGEPADGVATARAAADAQVAFVFPGQGSQWPGMAVDLWDTAPAFAASMDACAAALAPHIDWSLEEVLRRVPGAPGFDRLDVAQTALFAVHASLAALWRSSGVEPTVVVGHSAGEAVAAYVAGALSLPDAARVAALRSQALAPLAQTGGLMSVLAPPAAVAERIAPWGERLAVAAHNGPATTIVSGDHAALGELLAAYEAEGVRARTLQATCASHSAHVEEVREQLLSDLAPIAPVAGSVRMWSTALDRYVDGTELGAEYWYRNVREPVRFAQAIQALRDDGIGLFVESSAHPVITWAIQETAPDVHVVGSLRRDEGTLTRFETSAGEAWTHGAPVAWRRMLGDRGARRVDLPTYAFQRRRFWLEAPPVGGADLRAAGLEQTGHPLLGAAVELAGEEGRLLTGRLSLTQQPWLADHVVDGRVLLPGTAFAELALRAGAQTGAAAVRELTLEAPLVLEDGVDVAVQVRVGAADAAGGRPLEIQARPDGGEWTRHAAGMVAPAASVTGAAPTVWPPEGAEAMVVDDLYDRLAARGLPYGPAFANVRAAWARGDELFAEVELGEDAGGAFEIHPALLDAALQPAFAGGDPPLMPFHWSDLEIHARGTRALRAALVRDGERVRLTAHDPQGALVVSLGGLLARPAAAGSGAELLRTTWVATAASSPAPARIAALGGLLVPSSEPHPDLAALSARTTAQPPGEGSEGVSPPDAVAVEAPRDLAAALALVQAWLADDRLGAARLVLVTCGAVATTPGEHLDPAAAAVWGLVRSAQTEQPGRLVLLDGDPALAPAALACGEPQLAARGGALLVPRLQRAPAVPLPDRAWRLRASGRGSLDGVVAGTGAGDRPLAGGEVRLAVRAAGVNFRDVLIALGAYPGAAEIGLEAAGVIAEVGPGVEGLALGDRVFGLVPTAFGPLAVADARTVVPMPDGWSFADAAALPAAYATVRHALCDIALLQPGERVLIHAASGGVGLAAVAMAQQLGAEVFATASEAKWPVLAALGIDDAHLASSRSAAFAERFDDIDVVLNSLTGELVDASLRVLRPGGRFVELGKADVREDDELRPDITYRAVDVFDAGPERLGELLSAIAADAASGALQALPVTAFDVRAGADALRFASQARHVGKVVLTVPRALDPDGTVLITGGTGTLGAITARHLAAAHGVSHLVLCGRQGADAPGAAELVAELAALGCAATIAACDVADRDAVAAVLTAIGDTHPLTAVVHAAGTLADGVIGSLDAAALERVRRPKAEAARVLHELTAGADLAAFVVYSSIAGTFGTAGQANYAAANAEADALVARRRAAGLPGTSIAWGLWEEASALTGDLSRRDVERLSRLGVRPVATAQGLEMLDAALVHPEPVLVGAPPDLGVLRGQAGAGEIAPLVSGLVPSPAGVAASSRSDLPMRPRSGSTFSEKLAAAEDPDGLVLEIVRAQAAAVLGHDSGADIEPETNFREQGVDSLEAMELRNRLGLITGLALPSTIVFDRPDPVSIAAYIRAQAEGTATEVVTISRELAERAPNGIGAADSTQTIDEMRAALQPLRDPEAVPHAASNGQGHGGRLAALAARYHDARFRAWVLRARLTLARHGCALTVIAPQAPRFDRLPQISIGAMGPGRGSLTLRFGRDCRFGADVILDVATHLDGTIEVGDLAYFQSRIRLQPWGGAIRLGRQAQVRDGTELKAKGELILGDGVIVSRNVTVHCHERIELRDGSGLAEGATVMDSDHTHDGSDRHFLDQPVVSTPVLIEENVFVAMNAVVLRGSHVGRNAIVATGAVLTGGEYPASHLLAGVPAVAVRRLAD